VEAIAVAAPEIVPEIFIPSVNRLRDTVTTNTGQCCFDWKYSHFHLRGVNIVLTNKYTKQE